MPKAEGWERQNFQLQIRIIFFNFTMQSTSFSMNLSFPEENEIC